jgi:hypothetical protein
VSALGNIAADSPSCRDLVLSHGALIPLLSHLNEQADNLSMLRNAAWTLSNFFRGMPRPSFEQVVVIFVKLKLNLQEHFYMCINTRFLWTGEASASSSPAFAFIQ